MPITKTINSSMWADVRSERTGNPVAEQEILSLARKGELLLEEDGCILVPVEEGDDWIVALVLREEDFARAYCIPPNEAHQLLHQAAVPSFAEWHQLFMTQKLWRPEDIKKSLGEYSAHYGLDEHDAALELGLTAASYRHVLDDIPFSSNGRVLKPMLESYRRRFLPKDKVWSTRSTLLHEFVENHNRSEPDARLELQFCDVVDCGHVASTQCCNPTCRSPSEPRFLCPAHENWLDVSNMSRRPPSLCPTCTALVRAGNLGGFTLL